MRNSLKPRRYPTEEGKRGALSPLQLATSISNLRTIYEKKGGKEGGGSCWRAFACHRTEGRSRHSAALRSKGGRRERNASLPEKVKGKKFEVYLYTKMNEKEKVLIAIQEKNPYFAQSKKESRNSGKGCFASSRRPEEEKGKERV